MTEPADPVETSAPAEPTATTESSVIIEPTAAAEPTATSEQDSGTPGGGNEQEHAPPENTNQPDGTAIITARDGGIMQAANVTVAFNEGAIERDITVVYQKHTAPSQVLPQGKTGLFSFTLNAYEGDIRPVTNFRQPYNLTVKYTAQQINAAGVEEESLGLAYLDEERGEWVEVSSQVDSGTKQVTAELDHFTEFALMGDTSALTNVYLPVIVR
jgi:hypothetical protein